MEIVALSGPQADAKWHVGRESVTIGRSSGVQLQLRDDAVSKRHARIDWSREHPLIHDLGSRNGTFIDGVPVTGPTPVVHGALITLGNTILRADLEGPLPATQAASVADTVIHETARVVVGGVQMSRIERCLRSMIEFAREGSEPGWTADGNRRLLRTVLRVTGADHAAIARAAPEGGEVSMLGACSSDEARPSSLVISRTVARQVAESGLPQVCEETVPGDHATERGGSALRRSVICVPLRWQAGETADVLQVWRGEGQPPFDEADMRMVVALRDLAEVVARSRGTDEPGGCLDPVSNRVEAEAVPTLVVASRAMRSVVSIVKRAAASGATLLLQGESGTGKEILARLAHRSSDRAGRPLVRVNCASIEESLAESELFGHERGAFTGAVRRHRGRFEQADTGTLFLDEIAELSPRSQSKLLRVLEDGVIERVGGESEERVDVRVIAATNQDLRKATAEGRFREDLLHRLAVLPITIPPLRDRPEDIPALVDHFVQRFCRQYLSAGVMVEPTAMKVLTGYPWPGNVRQLRNVIEQVIVLQDGDPVGAEAVEAALAFYAPLHDRRAVGTSATLEEARREFERQYVSSVLERCGGNRTRAARILGIARQNLALKLKKLHLAGPAAPGAAPPDPPAE